MIPCSAEMVTIELIEESGIKTDANLVKNASAAVLHYFQNELGRTHVSISEFSDALEKVLRGFGYDVVSAEEKSPDITISDLREIAFAAGKGCELFFFSRLRQEFEKRMEKTPTELRFTGLKGCVKQLMGAQRWSSRCTLFSDQIVTFLRDCYHERQDRVEGCALVVL
ncbi:MAG: hypothetical protein JWN25_3003 [Verrucomicrobiales bacterium]|nr:hypothetical protein [Verrucomicrobiales bacterium]